MQTEKTTKHIGRKVHYIDSQGNKQNGLVKARHPTKKSVFFVVYNCGGNWKHFMNYTGVYTSVHNLQPGWTDGTNDNYDPMHTDFVETTNPCAEIHSDDVYSSFGTYGAWRTGDYKAYDHVGLLKKTKTAKYGDSYDNLDDILDRLSVWVKSNKS